MTKNITVVMIAEMAHAVNRAYCESLGDSSQLPWGDAPQWQKDSAVEGVKYILENPDSGPECSHESWLKQKYREGWAYGQVKDSKNKTHPCCVPYIDLPQEQKAKDYIFGAVVRAVSKYD